MIQDLKIPYARRDNGSVTTPGWEAALPKAKRCTYTCLQCGEPLTLRAASSEFRAAHFAHRPDSAYREGRHPESLIHLAAKTRAMEALRAATALTVQWPCAAPKCGRHTEVSLKDTRYRLDVALKLGGDIVFALEARQTHAVDELKARALDRSVPWIEFDAQELAEHGVWRVVAGRHPDLPQTSWHCSVCVARQPSKVHVTEPPTTIPELPPTRQELLAAVSWNDPVIRQAVRARLMAVHVQEPDIQRKLLESIDHILDNLAVFPVLGTCHHIKFQAKLPGLPNDIGAFLSVTSALQKAGIFDWVTSFPKRHAFNGLPVDPRDCTGLFVAVGRE